MKLVSLKVKIPLFIAEKVAEYSRALGKSKGRLVTEMLAKEFGISIIDGCAMDLLDKEEWNAGTATGGSNA